MTRAVLAFVIVGAFAPAAFAQQPATVTFSKDVAPIL